MTNARSGRKKMVAASQEAKVRHILSRAWSQQHCEAESPVVQNALELDLNREFADRDNGAIRYFFLMAVLLRC